MRKINAILGPLLIILLLIHAIWGSFQLSGILAGGNMIKQILSYIMAVAIAAHILIGIKLTADTLIALHRSRSSYFKENLEFWIRRISGLALIIFIIWHLLVFKNETGAVFRLQMFGGLQLAAHLMLAVTLIIHLAFNIKPLFIALGIADRKYVKDVIIILVIILLLCAAAFIIYYLRWNILWRYRG